jgi:hypothetical protein
MHFLRVLCENFLSGISLLCLLCRCWILAGRCLFCVSQMLGSRRAIFLLYVAPTACSMRSLAVRLIEVAGAAFLLLLSEGINCHLPCVLSS